MKQEFCPTDMGDHVRVDKYFAEVCPDLSRSYIRKLLKSGQVLVNDQGVEASYIVMEEDRIELEVPEAVEPKVDAEPMDLDILHEGQGVILINKPKGMVVHPAARHYSHTFVSSLMYHYRDQLSGISGIIRPGIVHRIDMGTTGVITVCKNDMARSSIVAQLKEHSITRKYQATVHGVIAENEGTVNAPIGRHPMERRRMSISYRSSKDIATHYKILNRLRQYTHIECGLEIGRTHQIRVHMASIHHPLLGDAMYGPARYPIGGLCGQTLYADVLGFIHPRTGEYMEFTAPLPEYFGGLLHTLN